MNYKLGDIVESSLDAGLPTRVKGRILAIDERDTREFESFLVEVVHGETVKILRSKLSWKATLIEEVINRKGIRHIDDGIDCKGFWFSLNEIQTPRDSKLDLI